MKAVLLLAAVAALGGCTEPASNAFDVRSDVGARTAQAAAPAAKPVVRIGEIRGPSNLAVRSLRDALTAALARRGIEVVRRRGGSVIELTGELAALNEGKVTTYTYDWRMANGDGWAGRPVVGFERAPGGSSNAWVGMAGGTAHRMAEKIARRLVLALRRRG